MANTEGTFTASMYETGRVVVDLRKEIFILNPDITPFLTFGQDLEGETTGNMEFDTFEDAWLDWTDSAKSAAAADATTVYVNNPTAYAVDMVLENQTTQEHMLCTSVVSGSSYILVTRAFGETDSATVLADDVFLILGPAALEGNTSQNGLITTKTSVYNYARTGRLAA